MDLDIQQKTNSLQLQEEEQPIAVEVDKTTSENNVVIILNGNEIKSKLNPNAQEFIPSFVKQIATNTRTVEEQKNIEQPLDAEVPVPTIDFEKQMFDVQNHEHFAEGKVENLESIESIESLIKNQTFADLVVETEIITPYAEITDEQDYLKNTGVNIDEDISKLDLNETENKIIQKVVEDEKSATASTELQTEIEKPETAEISLTKDLQLQSLKDEPTQEHQEEKLQEMQDVEQQKEQTKEQHQEQQKPQMPQEVHKQMQQIDKTEILEITETVGDSSSVESLKELTSFVNDKEEEFIMETGMKLTINKLTDSQTKIKPKKVFESKAPPTTPTGELLEKDSRNVLRTENGDREINRCRSFTAINSTTPTISNTSFKEDKKKSEKSGAMKAISRITSGLHRKTTTTNIDKTGTTATKSSSQLTTRRTNKITDSLLNISTALKSKSDLKKIDKSKIEPKIESSVKAVPKNVSLLTKKGTTATGIASSQKKEPIKKTTLKKDAVDTKEKEPTTDLRKSTNVAVSSKSTMDKSKSTSAAATAATSASATTTTIKSKSKVTSRTSTSVSTPLRRTDPPKLLFK